MAIPTQEALFEDGTVALGAVSLAEKLGKFGTPEEGTLYRTKPNLRAGCKKLDGMYANGEITLDLALDETYGFCARVGVYAHELMHDLTDGALRCLGYGVGSREAESYIEWKTGAVLSAVKNYAVGKVKQLADYGYRFWRKRQRDLGNEGVLALEGVSAQQPAHGGGAQAGETLRDYAVPALWQLPLATLRYGAELPLTFVENLLSMGRGQPYHIAEGFENHVGRFSDTLTNLYRAWARRHRQQQQAPGGQQQGQQPHP